MNAPSSPLFGPARIVALVLIALSVLTLGYLAFGSDDASVSVPARASAGELTLKPCNVDTEAGSRRADCGTLVVPENRAKPGSRLIALPVTRIRARSRQPGEPIFRLEGGPGLTNMEFPQASRFSDEHDIVLVGYRGVDGSSVLDCPEVVSALKHSTDFLGSRSMRAYSDGFRACATRLRADGVDLAGYTLPQRVDDLEAARVALGYKRVDLLSESAGTRTAMIYAWRHPKSIHRSVMIGVNPPGGFVANPATTDAQLRHYADLCAADAACKQRTPDLVASMRRTAADIPDHWSALPIAPGNARLAGFFGLIDSSSEAAPLSAPMTLDTWLTAADGDPSGFWFASLMSRLAFPEAFVWGEFAAFGRIDADVARRHFAADTDRGSILGNPAAEFLWAGGELVDAWPANKAERQYRRVQPTDVETLLIGGTLDFATPPEWATKQLLPSLRNGHQVVLAELGHTTDFWSYRPKASTELVGTFLASGKVDDRLYGQRKVDFTPSTTQPAMAKGIASATAGLAVLTLLALVWLPLRVRRRRRIGRTASAALRSAFPFVLGLGGWSAGLLAVLTLAPSVALDDMLLAVGSIGTPIGLCIYWAWVDRDWPAGTRAAGLAAAIAGALVGSWLGFSAGAGLFAVVTTILGATAGANLAVIARDVARERSARRRAPAAAAGWSGGLHPLRTDVP